MSWIESPLVEALGWALLHSVWQVAAVALALWAALRVLRRASANARYLAGVTALVCAALLWSATLAAQWRRPATVVGSAPVAAAATPPTSAPPARAARAGVPMRQYLPYVVPFWLAGVMLAWCRTLAAGCAAGRLRRVGVTPVPSVWQERLEALAARMHLARPVRLLQSLRVDTPVVLGLLRPVVLVPAGALTGIDAAQLEAILAHELAHVRRHDYLVNLAQHAVGNLLFYHPAIWWISARIREERENACDEMAVEVTGDTRTYVLALANLEESRLAAAGPALAATGGDLMKRVRRLLRRPEDRRPAGVPATVAVVLTLLAGVTLAAWQAPPDRGAGPRPGRAGRGPAPPTAAEPQTANPQPPTAAEPPQPAAEPREGLAIRADGDYWLHGWFNDADREQANRNAKGHDWVWMRRAGRTYLIDDQGAILQAFNAYAKAAKCGSDIRHAKDDAARLRAALAWCEIPVRESDARRLRSLEAVQKFGANAREALNRARHEKLMLETHLQNLKNQADFLRQMGASPRTNRSLEEAEAAMATVQAQIQARQREIEWVAGLRPAEAHGLGIQNTVDSAASLAMDRVWRILDAAIADGRAHPIQ